MQEATQGVISRLIKWHDGAPVKASQELIEAALADYIRTQKRMAVAAHMNPAAFSRQVLGDLRS